LIAVAIDNGIVVGMASAFSYVHPDKPLQLFVNEVGVSKTHQRLGLGKKLVRLILERGQELGCTEAWVATEEENAPARALYSSLGGKEDPSLAAVYTYALQAIKKP
jgi:aminoglycoside 6'-N-acetyltransferase I